MGVLLTDTDAKAPVAAGMAAPIANEASQALVEAAGPERPLRGNWAWFGGFILWTFGWMVLALQVPEYYGYADMWALRVSMLAAMCFYLSLCNAILPLPTAWIVLLAAAPQYAVVETGWLRVLIVATLASLSTVMANLNEYHVLSYVLRWGWGQRLRRTRVYGWAIRWFDKAPFQLLALIAFIPLPIDAVRWLAVLRRYPRGRFALAYLVGRWPRYMLFAWCSVWLALRGWQIVLIQVGLVCVALAARLLWHLVQRMRRRAGNAAAS
jgi:membrane protein YqaA with SNARE-associated domain